MIANRNANGEIVTANVTQRRVSDGGITENIALPDGSTISISDNKVQSAQSPSGVPVTTNPFQAAIAFFTNNVMLIAIVAVILIVYPAMVIPEDHVDIAFFS